MSAFALPRTHLALVPAPPQDVGPAWTDLATVVTASDPHGTARRLARLGADWHVLHEVPAGVRRARIDHLVIGPAGVFTVATRRHRDGLAVASDTQLVDRSPGRCVRRGGLDARRVSRRLAGPYGDRGRPVAVTALVAVAADVVQRTVRPAPDVVVLDARRLARHLRTLPPALGANEVADLLERARRSTTWTPGPGPRNR